MDKAADDVAKVFAGNQPLTVLSKRRDGLGTTHHEAGTLWIGSDPSKSVTNADGRIHFVERPRRGTCPFPNHRLAQSNANRHRARAAIGRPAVSKSAR